MQYFKLKLFYALAITRRVERNKRSINIIILLDLERTQDYAKYKRIAIM